MRCQIAGLSVVCMSQRLQREPSHQPSSQLPPMPQSATDPLPKLCVQPLHTPTRPSRHPPARIFSLSCFFSLAWKGR